MAVNLLLPFARRAHFEAASEADVVVTFWGTPKRQTAKLWIHMPNVSDLAPGVNGDAWLAAATDRLALAEMRLSVAEMRLA